MATNYRHPVGKSTISGYLIVKPNEESFFGSDPGSQGRDVEISFGERQRVSARLYRTSGKTRQLKLVFTGEECQPFRRWLSKKCPRRKARQPRGVLSLARKTESSYLASVESIAQAEVQVLELGGQRFFAGARPLSVLHPALMGFKDLLASIVVSKSVTPTRLMNNIEKVLLKNEWVPAANVGGGLALPGGFRRSNAQLHFVLEAKDIFESLLSVAAAFELGVIDLGLVIVADGSLARKLGQAVTGSQASLDRAVSNLRTLDFLVRGPLGVFALSMKKQLR
jgi:hypothetical protein